MRVPQKKTASVVQQPAAQAPAVQIPAVQISVQQVAVRQMEPRDAAEVALLISELGYERAAEEVLTWIEGLGRDRQTAYVASIDDKVVGWIEVSIACRLQTGPHGLIGGLVVKEGFRGSGIGRRLCEQAEAWTWQQQMDTLRVTSRNTRSDAHRFYLRDGYRQVKTSLVFEKKRPQ
jgi:GNAT superfamily N-acetyltransferase